MKTKNKLPKEQDKNEVSYQGIFKKNIFYKILEHIDFLKLNGYKFVTHLREDLDDDTVKIEYILESK